MSNQNFVKVKYGSVQSKQAVQAVKKALAEDPTVFQYDEVYDDMERERVEKKEKAKGDRKPKYIHALLKTAERRQREFERRIEKDVQRELEKEGDKFKDKEAFVTSAYKKKMEELKRIEEEEKRQDAIDDMTEVTKQKDLSGFYRHLYRETLDKPQCEVKKTAADSSSDVTSSPEKKPRRGDDHDDEDLDEPSHTRRPGRSELGHSESDSKRKSSNRRDSEKESKDFDAKDYYRDRSDKDHHRERSEKDRVSSHRHHHHHRDRSRSRERDRKRDRETDRHRDYDRRDKRDRDRDDRGKHRGDRDRDYDKRKDRGSSDHHHHRYHPYSRRDAPKSSRAAPPRSRSRTPPRKHTASTQSSTFVAVKHQDPLSSKERGRSTTPPHLPPPPPSASISAKVSTSAVQSSQSSGDEGNEHPVWKRRTVDEAYKNALKRYEERKRSGRTNAEICKDK